MSLNGLDGTAVAGAHQAALAEAGGWFLLKYVNRDTVELLQKGTGGVQEVRGVVEKYQEKSPLYGLLQYRRKKVILKYVPEGTSRLLQVRLTVQFQSVLETFTPHDIVFSFTVASELTDSALGLSTMLLPSAASLTSSTSSLRRRRLDEITEDNEEGTPAPEENVIHPAQVEEPPAPSYGRRELDELPASAVLAKALLAKRKEEAATSQTADSAHSEFPLPPSKASFSHRATASLVPTIDKALPDTPESTPPTTSEGEPARAPDFEAASNILLDATNRDPTEPPTPRPLHSRHLSTAESDSISQWSSNVASYASVKAKKKKLGPRPHVETPHRPKTSGTVDSSISIRPIANLPNSIRVSNRPLLSLSGRPGSQQSTRSVPGRFANSTHSFNGPPPLPSLSHIQSLYNPIESRPAISRPASVTTEASTATPEKLRMMKALQLRKRNMLLAQRSTMSPTTSHAPNASETSLSTVASSNELSTTPSQEQLFNIDEESKLTQSSATTSPTFMTNISGERSTKASSFTEQDDVSRKRRSLSSATSSSITPKAPVQDNRTPTKALETPIDGRSCDRRGFGVPFSESEQSGFAKEESIQHQNRQSQAADMINPSTIVPSTESPTKSKRHTPPQPLRLAGGDTSASDLSEDESLMDDIHNATVHEAKPISVARSPVTPILSKGSSDKLRELVSKSSHSNYPSRPSRGSTPETKPGSRSGSVRSVSTALPQWPPLQAETMPVPLTKKPTLGTGISKRIKALEVLTAKDTNTQQPVPPVRETSGGKSAFSAFIKRSSLVANQPKPNASTDVSPPKKLPAFASQSDHSKHAQDANEHGRPSIDSYASFHKADTISVTAKIVRDPSSKHPPMSPSSSYNTPLNLFRSPLIVEHEKHENLPREDSFASMQSGTKSPTKSDRGRFSFSSHRSSSHPNLPRSESDQSKLSQSSTHKKHGPRSASDAASISEEKSKTSRTSRLMKRVSNLTSSRSKGQMGSKDQSHPSTIQEQSEPLRDNSVSESLMHVIDIGDVNVQFPESLLWKRRFMRIDDQGYLIFSPPMTDANMKSVSRKYHLSDFNRPSLPDLEREEIAWSIVLDLKDGRCVQCACESKSTQQQVLQSE
ncbi:hypothetical protein LTR47_001770 [Exophiala xenobiotica]|nr:hypothetical protein LTR47_001770 [Exophiala xenobiotica]KAK5254578.1 hypothetical protein LTS06_001068 [Exophiala xenobiotica]KAK5354619.1 hypothetical protein LTR61_001919 [Exophiala xenobiotica]KAK5381800.1 hypothetical protein LTR11_003285 [Exophiala xenobiotica]KAK5382610.1 hypothetical protein LTS03_003147 [Exophiala xenobiotica]